MCKQDSAALNSAAKDGLKAQENTRKTDLDLEFGLIKVNIALKNILDELSKQQQPALSYEFKNVKSLQQYCVHELEQLANSATLKVSKTAIDGNKVLLNVIFPIFGENESKAHNPANNTVSTIAFYLEGILKQRLPAEIDVKTRDNADNVTIIITLPEASSK